MSRSSAQVEPLGPPTPGSLDELDTPSLVVDGEILEANLREMQGLATEVGVALRPHWKTHKCVEIAARQIELGAVGGTVAKASEAELFLAAGFTDVEVHGEHERRPATADDTFVVFVARD